MDEAPSAETGVTPGNPGPVGLEERLDRLERVVRAAGRDSLESVQGSRDALQDVHARLGQVDLLVKAVRETVESASRESHEAMEKAEQHFAGAIRELEGRLRDEMQWQIYRNALQAVLPALDDLDLILLHPTPVDEAPGIGLAEAVVLVRQKLVSGLRKLGVEEIVVERGDMFDPSTHHAAESDLPAMVDVEDVPPGTVLFVRRAGFRLNDRVFRRPQVIVRR
jgi:molecular chaperone GrpE (heat shock protein)